jgi:hypothetical protein
MIKLTKDRVLHFSIAQDLIEIQPFISARQYSDRAGDTKHWNPVRFWLEYSESGHPTEEQLRKIVPIFAQQTVNFFRCLPVITLSKNTFTYAVIAERIPNGVVAVFNVPSENSKNAVLWTMLPANTAGLE